MGPKTVTQEDLSRVRNEIERGEDQKRHDLRDSMQKVIVIADDAKDLSKEAISSVKSMDKRMENMERDIKEIKDLMERDKKETRESMDKRFDRMEEIFQKHAEQEERDRKEQDSVIESNRKEAEEKYATKKDHEANAKSITDIQQTYVTALKALVVALLGAIGVMGALIWNNLPKLIG